jgi:hypothetical protein
MFSNILQYVLDVVDPHLADLGFNGPDFGAGLFRKHRASPVESEVPANPRQL